MQKRKIDPSILHNYIVIIFLNYYSFSFLTKSSSNDLDNLRLIFSLRTENHFFAADVSIRGNGGVNRAKQPRSEQPRSRFKVSRSFRRAIAPLTNYL